VIHFLVCFHHFWSLGKLLESWEHWAVAITIAVTVVSRSWVRIHIFGIECLNFWDRCLTRGLEFW
jgi:hypothetical protein